MSLFARLARMADAAAEDALPGDDAILLGDDFDAGRNDAAPIPAAVLVAVVDRPEPGLLLTQRTATLRNHAGQIAFPGGRVDAGEDTVAAALREAREEIGLDTRLVRVVGVTDPYRTVTGFAVTPVLAVVPPDLVLVAQPDEVAAIFEVPLAFVTDPSNQTIRYTDWRGRRRAYHEILWGEWRIWGATAAMIVNLSRRLARTGSPS